MYHIYGESDRTKYQHTLDRRTKGDTMCTTLEQLRDKSPYDLLTESEQLNNIPVNLDAILEHFNVVKIPTTFESIESLSINKNKGPISGLVLSNKDELGIFYKKTDSIHRKRFTIAHELAHCCLHTDDLKEGYIEFRNPDYSNEKERDADIFAGELLIPEGQLEYAIQRLLRPSLDGLANIFEVSANVMRARLEYLQKPYFDDSINKYITLES